MYGTSGNKIGNAHLRWAFSEAAALYLRGNKKAQNYHARLVKKHGNGKAMGILSGVIERPLPFKLQFSTQISQLFYVQDTIQS